MMTKMYTFRRHRGGRSRPDQRRHERWYGTDDLIRQERAGAENARSWYFEPVQMQKRSVCQDRLGTNNIRKVSRKKAIFVFYLQDVVEVLEGLIVSAHGGNIPVQLPLPRAAAAAAAAEAEDAVAEVAARL